MMNTPKLVIVPGPTLASTLAKLPRAVFDSNGDIDPGSYYDKVCISVKVSTLFRSKLSSPMRAFSF
jgi:hypothetical protein